MRWVLALILVFATLPAYAASCKSLKDFQTGLKVDLQIPAPVIDQSMTRRELNKGEDARHKEWLKKNGMESVWSAGNLETAGLASGGSGLVFAFKLTGKAHDEYGFEVCPYFKTADVEMMYRTIISIPKEYPKDSCAYNVIITHEMRHHNTNVTIVKNAVTRFQKDLPTIISAIENGVPYIDHRTAQSTGENMKSQFEDATHVYLNQTIMKAMEQENSKIDSPEEYERSSKLLAECAAHSR